MSVQRYTLKIRGRFAAPARPETADDLAVRAARGGLPQHIDDACWAWARWTQTRHLLAPPPRIKSPLGNLGQRPLREFGAGPDAMLSAELSFLNLAIAAHAQEREYAVFWAHYVYRPRSIKAAAARLRIGRQHWYTQRNAFARRVWEAHLTMLAAESVASKGDNKGADIWRQIRQNQPVFL